MDNIFTSFGILIGLAVFIVIVAALFLLKCYKRASDITEMLAIKKFNGEIKIAPQGGIVLPLFNSYNIIDLVTKRFTVVIGDAGDKLGHIDPDDNKRTNAIIFAPSEGNYTKDSVRINAIFEFKLKVPEKHEDLAKAVKVYGNMLSSDAKMLGNHLQGQLSDAIKAATRKLMLDELMDDKEQCRNHVLEQLGKDLDGLVIADVSIITLKHVDIDKLDPNNSYDNEGRKVLEARLAIKNIERERIEQDQKTKITETRVAGETARSQMEGNLQQEKVRIERAVKNTEEEERTKMAQVVAEEDLKRNQIAIDTERKIETARLEKDRDLEQVSISNGEMLGIKQEEARKNVEQQRLDADMVTEKRKVENEVEIAKTQKSLLSQQAENTLLEDGLVKTQQEIKDTEAFREAERIKKVLLTQSEGESESEKIKLVINAQAQKEKATIDANTRSIEAEANFKVTERNVEAGRLEVALNIDKIASEEKAVAEGIKSRSEARRIEGEVEAEVIEKKGKAEAEVIAKTGAANAESIEKVGYANASAQKEIYKAMAETGSESRDHEVRMKNIENDRIIKEAQIAANRDVGVEESRARAKAFEHSNMTFYGDKEMLDRVTGATRDAVANNASIDNDVLKSAVLKPYINKERNIVDDLAKVIGTNGEGTNNPLVQTMIQFAVANKLINNDQVNDMLNSVTDGLKK